MTSKNNLSPMKTHQLVSSLRFAVALGATALAGHAASRPFDFKDPVGFEKSDYLHALPDAPLDVIVVDGTEEWNYVRPTCFRHAEKFIKPGGIIVVDDSWRYPELHRKHRAKRVQSFQSVGPCRPGVTSTDIFFY